jgi:serine/threonine-protein kinase RsbT
MRWRRLERPDRRGIELEFIDEGPGIPDVHLAMQQGYSTGRGLGLGLPAAKRLMDELEIRTAPGAGTTVTSRKWCPP